MRAVMTTLLLAGWVAVAPAQEAPGQLQQDAADLQNYLRTNYPQCDVSVTPLGRGLVLTGEVAEVPQLDRIEGLARLVADRVANHLTVRVMAQVQAPLAVQVRAPQYLLRTRMLEISHAQLRKEGLELPMLRTAPANEALLKLLSALVENQSAKVLFEPNLAFMPGSPVSFMAGGEASWPGLPAAPGYQPAEQGLRLEFMPILLGDGRVRLERLRQRVTDTKATAPAPRVREIETQVVMRPGESMVITGPNLNDAEGDDKTSMLLLLHLESIEETTVQAQPALQPVPLR